MVAGLKQHRYTYFIILFMNYNLLKNITFTLRDRCFTVSTEVDKFQCFFTTLDSRRPQAWTVLYTILDSNIYLYLLRI